MTTLQRIFYRGAYALGHPFVVAADATYEMSWLSWRALKQLPSLPRELSVVAERFMTLVVRTAPLVFLASFATGAVMALQFGLGMSRFGGKLYVPTVVAVAIVKALGPMLAALMAASRAGSGLAAELAGMTVSQQIDAIRALGSEPDRKLLTPSLAVLVVGLPCLALLADLAGILGGMAIAATNLSMPPKLYLLKAVETLQLGDALIGIAKTALYGLIIGLVACREGLRPGKGTSGIGDATTKTVVAATVLVLAADLVLTKLLWLLQ